MTEFLLCPNCREPLDSASLLCPAGHKFAYEDGVLVLLQEQFGRQLRAFTAAFGATRAAENKRLLAASSYEALPFAQTGGDADWRLGWRLRCYDLAVVLKLLEHRSRIREATRRYANKDPNLRAPSRFFADREKYLTSVLGERNEQQILDVGAWNGWLSHRLAARGHDVTAVDYFTDEYDGLGARKFYSTDWRAIQIDLGDLSVLNQRYDVVILNRCLQFFTDPIAYVGIARQQLAPGGLLILTGLQFFQDARAKARDVAALRQAYQERYGLELFLKPTKGYLDFVDRQRLRAQGVRLQPYPQLWPANIRSMLNRALPRHCYGVCRL